MNGYQDAQLHSQLSPWHVDSRRALEELAATDHNLNIPRYVEPKAEQAGHTVEQAINNFKRTHWKPRTGGSHSQTRGLPSLGKDKHYDY